MASSIISELKKTLGTGARANRYKVLLFSPGGGPEGEEVNTLVQSTSMPGKSFADIEVWVQGRKLTVAGDITFAGSWSCTFLDTESHSLRNKFIAWMDYIDNYDKHTRGPDSTPEYMTSVVIQQLSAANNEPTVSCTLQNAYVKSISDISYADDNSALVEFTVEFNYSHWIN